MELFVVAGADAGCQFTLEGDEVLVGRGQPQTGLTSVIRLEDKSISRQQAWIRRDASGASISHIASASNPTTVNGREVAEARLSLGDRIEMGRVAIDVRLREGTNISGLTEIMEGATRSPIPSSASLENTQPTVNTAPPIETAIMDEQTDIRPMNVRLGELTLLRGASSDSTPPDRTFPIEMGSTRIGRAADVEVRIADRGVSRLHAELAIEDGRLVLHAKSRTNPTLVNDFPVLGSAPIADGDEIQLADRVVLGVRLRRSDRTRLDSPPGLSQKMESKIHLDRSIEEFNVMGTFLDVDVVASRALKGGSAKAEHIIVSFERFRAYVGGICRERGGQILNSNGDELMCFFESAASAILAGSAILERLADFNRERNLLSRDFRFRIGAHTGLSLVDLDAGMAYSEVLDTAGHIQKLAAPDSLVISHATLESLPRRIPVTPVGELSGGGRTLYRVDRAIRPDDLRIDEYSGKGPSAIRERGEDT
jgi:pSer/pThr/pTyr-binding forkhead associated (FHA) protein